MAKTKSEEQKIVEKILEKQNKTYNDWKNETVEKVQIQFFQKKDTDLTDYVIRRESNRLIQKECKKNLNK